MRILINLATIVVMSLNASVCFSSRIEVDTFERPSTTGTLASPVTELPPELLNHIFEQLGNLSFHSTRNVCKGFAVAADFQIKQRLAKKEIESLIGNYVLLPPGSYIMGPPEPAPGQAGEPPFSNEFRKPITIENPFLMSETQVTQGQYEALLPKRWKAHQALIKQWAEKKGEFEHRVGEKFNPRNFIGHDLPMLLLTRDESSFYAEKLRERLRSLWGVAYPKGDPRHNQLVLPRLPTEAEWEYATTEQIEGDPETVEVNGEQFQITARHQKYPNGNSEDSIPPRGRKWEEGPFEEVAQELKVNSRGIRGMGGTIWEQTSGPYASNVNHVGNPVRMAVRGGSWVGLSRHCRSSSRGWAEVTERMSDFGLRLVSDFVPPGLRVFYP
jgi:formylglycine-generating enzyme required for sulfatase activity